LTRQDGHHLGNGLPDFGDHGQAGADVVGMDLVAARNARRVLRNDNIALLSSSSPAR
jgi:hypothetical protein